MTALILDISSDVANAVFKIYQDKGCVIPSKCVRNVFATVENVDITVV